MLQHELFPADGVQPTEVPEQISGSTASRACTWDLRLGHWQTALADVECDALITDTPYSERTHSAYREMAKVGRKAISYACFTPDDVRDFVQSWAPRTSGWFVTLTDHVLAPVWADALEESGRYVFAPLACMEPGSRVRLAGDGPSQWSVWAVVARPKTRAAQKWRALPGGYVVPSQEGWRGPKRNGARNGIMGAKPLWLMRALVRDYTRPGQLVCDPCAGGATTLLAALIEGRDAIGAELDAHHHAVGTRRLQRGYTPVLPFGESV